MTIQGWFAFITMALIILVSGAALAYIAWDYKKRISGCAILVIAAMLIVGLYFGMRWHFNHTARGQRAMKTQESNFNNGIMRKVEVYDATGNLIREYEGKFDIDYDDDRIIFDDQDGMRHVIYYPTGTVIVDEIDGTRLK